MTPWQVSNYPTPASTFFTPQNAERIGRMGARLARNLFNSGRSRGSAPPFRPRSGARRTRGAAPQVYGGSATRPYTSQYRKRRLPRRKRLRARKYYKSFRKAFRRISGVALQKAMFNGSVTATALPIAQQWLATHLFSWNSTSGSSQETGARDCYQLLNTLVNPVFADDLDNSSKRMIEYGIIDMTLTNTSAARLEVDMYHIVYGNEKQFQSISALLTAANAAQNSLTGTAADRITINNRGATLFDLNQFISLGAIKVLSKEKMFMASGDVYNFQYKVKKLKSITPNQVNQEHAHVAEPRVTHSWICVFKSVTGDTNTASLQLASTRSYGYRVDGLSEQGTAVLPE